VAPVLGLSADELVTGLKQQGYASATTDQPLAEIAKAAGKDSFALMSVLVAMKK
jgi:hypothetical protein